MIDGVLTTAFKHAASTPTKIGRCLSLLKATVLMVANSFQSQYAPLLLPECFQQNQVCLCNLQKQTCSCYTARLL